jgi:hypothetical protein
MRAKVSTASLRVALSCRFPTHGARWQRLWIVLSALWLLGVLVIGYALWPHGNAIYHDAAIEAADSSQLPLTVTDYRELSVMVFSNDANAMRVNCLTLRSCGCIRVRIYTTSI